MEDKEKEEIKDFNRKLVDSQQDLDPRFDKFISENFWDLIDSRTENENEANRMGGEDKNQ